MANSLPPSPKPMPTTASATRVLPNGKATFTNEAMKPPRLGQMSVNPGRK